MKKTHLATKKITALFA